MTVNERRWAALFGACLIAAAMASAAIGDENLTDEQVRDLASKVRDFNAKFKLITIGQPAIVPLFDQLGDKDAHVVFQSQSTLFWIATHAGEEPAKRPPVVETLAQIAKSDRPIEQRAFAVKLLGLAAGEKAVEVLSPLLQDEKLRDAALASLIEAPDKAAAQAIVDAVPKAPVEFRCALLGALGYRRDATVTPVLLAAAKDADEKVRIAAVEALGASQDTAALPAVMEAAKGGSENVKKAALPACVKLADALLKKGQTREAADACSQVLELAADDAPRVGALDGLGRCGDAGVIPKLTSAADKGSDAVKAAALDACLRLADDLLDKGDSKQASALYDRVLASATRDAETMRALAGLGRVGDPASVSKIAPLLKSPELRVQAAASSALKQIKGPEATKAIGSALKDACPPLKLILLTALNERKDPAAVPDVVPFVGVEDEELAVAAINALGSIGDPSAVASLLPAIEKGTFKVKSAAFDAYVAIGDAELARQKPQEAMAIYHQALQSGAKKDAQRMAFEGLARIADPASLPVIEPMLEQVKGDTRESALNACVAIGDNLASADKREEAVRIYNKVLSLKPSAIDSLKQKLRVLGEKMEFEVKNGRMTYWWVLGPFPAPDVASWEKALPPEQEIDLKKEHEVDGKKLRWRPIETIHRDAIVDLEKVFGPNDKVVAYAYAEIIAKNDQDIFLRSSSDDGLLVWVNGERVFAFLQPRSTKVDEDKIKVHLKKGPNQLLLKICEIGGGWSFCMRATDDQDRDLSLVVK